MRKKWKNRCFAWALVGTMAFSGYPSVSVSAEENELSKLAEFNFDADASDGAFAGGGGLGTVNGGCSLELRAGTNKALYLNGSDSFLNVTKADGSSLLAGKENITISYEPKPDKAEKSWSFFAAPNGNKQSYEYEHYLGILHTSSETKVERYHNSGKRPGNNLESTVDSEWTHVDVVVSENHTKLYVNGKLKQEANSDYKLSEIVGTSGILQIGKANWDSGEYYKGLIDNYKIYDGALSQDAIETQYQNFQAELEQIEKDKEEQEKAMALQKDYDDLEILNADDVRGNVALIRQGRYGSTITWESSNKSVITDSAEGSLYDGGVVTRPNPGNSAVEVTLKATLKSAYNEDTKTKEFKVQVQPKEADLDTDYSAGYLWAHFGIAGGYEKMFFGYSEDGLTWRKLNKVDGIAKPVMENNAQGSDQGVRDPHIIRSAEGDRYWILGTDLHAEGDGPGGSGWNQLSASQNLVVWESTDLVNWSEPRLVYAGFDQAGCIWAPEAIYDDTTGDYVVYWSSRDKSKVGTEQNALRVYVCRTRDFKSFSEPKVWLSEDQDSGKEINIIDSSIVKDNGKFYRFSTSDWNTVIDVSDTLDTEDVLDVRNGENQSTPNGSWTRLVTRSGTGAAGFEREEGFTVYQLPDGRWCAMGDEDGYKAFVTNDLASGKFTKTTASFVDGRFRHGTVMRLSQAEQARVMEAYKDRESDPGQQEQPAKEPVLCYDFENDLNKKTITDVGTGNESKDHGKLFGNAAVVYDEERQSNVLYLDGSNGSYAEIPEGFFDKRNTMTISMDVRSDLGSGNFFTFTYGKDSTYYDFLRVRGTEVRNAITTSSYTAEKEVKASGALTGTWQNVVLVIDKTNMKLYLDGSLVDENTNTEITTASLGTDLLAYLGKSFYSPDGYFKGSFDNFKVYNRVLSEEEILDPVIDRVPLLKKITIGSTPQDPASTMGTDNHTAITAKMDQEKKEITSYVCKGTDLTAVPVEIALLAKNVNVKTEDMKQAQNGSSASVKMVLDLTQDVELIAEYPGKRTETYTIKTPQIARNPVLPGQYADPDIDYFDGKYWIYPTTDGYAGWGGTVFHAWSSENLEDWVDEGIILDVKDKNPGTNEKGVAIAVSPWSDGNAWAPSIEKKNGKYYFYYCGNVNDAYKDRCGGGKAIGVAVADNPAGPYVASELPIVYPKMMSNANIGFNGQVIDPSIFTDDDGKSYLFFGNGGDGTAMAELNNDMLSVKTETLKRVKGMKDFRESVVVVKRNGLYHFTWSCDDTGSPNYHVNYGTAEKLDGNVTFQYTLLAKDESGDMLGTAHQSLLYLPETDKCYIAYHRFYTPLGVYTDGLGYHRETCIEEVTFQENTGLMNPLRPTMEGVTLKGQEDPDKKEQEELDQIVEKADFKNVFQNGIIAKAGKLALPSSLEGASITWKSSNTSVISNGGKVTLPKKDTKVKMTAKFTYGKATASRTYQLTVKAQKPESVKLDVKSKITLGLKEKVQLKATISPKTASQKVSWKSSKPKIVYVSSKGVIQAKKTGKATITAYTSNGKKKSCTVTVKKAPKSLKLNKTAKTLRKGSTFQIKAKPSKDTASYQYTYSTSKKSVAVVSKTGKITAKKKGKAVITVKTYNNKKAKITITVK